jgi:hypothetical protein
MGGAGSVGPTTPPSDVLPLLYTVAGPELFQV